MRRFIATASKTLLLATVTLAGVTALAQSYPARPVKLIVNFPPGGPLDLIARALGNELQQSLKQAFVVDNRPGAGGNIGAAAARTPADGYTLLLSIDTPFTVNPHIYPTMPFKPADFKPLMLIASAGQMVAVNPAKGHKTLADLVAAGKGAAVTFSSAGSGSPGHLAAEVFADATGMKITHVPYKGNAPAVQALLAGEVDGGVLATPGLLPHVKAGKVTALAVTSSRRSPSAPDVPTVAEAGFKSLEQEVLYLAYVPAATPQPVVDTLQKAMADALAKPDMRQRLTALDLFPEVQHGPSADKRLTDLSARYARIIKATGMKVD